MEVGDSTRRPNQVVAVESGSAVLDEVSADPAVAQPRGQPRVDDVLRTEAPPSWPEHFRSTEPLLAVGRVLAPQSRDVELTARVAVGADG